MFGYREWTIDRSFSKTDIMDGPLRIRDSPTFDTLDDALSRVDPRDEDTLRKLARCALMTYLSPTGRMVRGETIGTRVTHGILDWAPDAMEKHHRFYDSRLHVPSRSAPGGRVDWERTGALDTIKLPTFWQATSCRGATRNLLGDIWDAMPSVWSKRWQESAARDVRLPKMVSFPYVSDPNTGLTVYPRVSHESDEITIEDDMIRRHQASFLRFVQSKQHVDDTTWSDFLRATPNADTRIKPFAERLVRERRAWDTGKVRDALTDPAFVPTSCLDVGPPALSWMVTQWERVHREVLQFPEPATRDDTTEQLHAIRNEEWASTHDTQPLTEDTATLYQSSESTYVVPGGTDTRWNQLYAALETFLLRYEDDVPLQLGKRSRVIRSDPRPLLLPFMRWWFRVLQTRLEEYSGPIGTPVVWTYYYDTDIPSGIRNHVVAKIERLQRMLIRCVRLLQHVARRTKTIRRGIEGVAVVALVTALRRVARPGARPSVAQGVAALQRAGATIPEDAAGVDSAVQTASVLEPRHAAYLWEVGRAWQATHTGRSRLPPELSHTILTWLGSDVVDDGMVRHASRVIVLPPDPAEGIHAAFSRVASLDLLDGVVGATRWTHNPLSPVRTWTGSIGMHKLPGVTMLRASRVGWAGLMLQDDTWSLLVWTSKGEEKARIRIGSRRDAPRNMPWMVDPRNMTWIDTERLAILETFQLRVVRFHNEMFQFEETLPLPDPFQGDPISVEIYDALPAPPAPRVHGDVVILTGFPWQRVWLTRTIDASRPGFLRVVTEPTSTYFPYLYQRPESTWVAHPQSNESFLVQLEPPVRSGTWYSLHVTLDIRIRDHPPRVHQDIWMKLKTIQTLLMDDSAPEEQDDPPYGWDDIPLQETKEQLEQVQRDRDWEPVLEEDERLKRLDDYVRHWPRGVQDPVTRYLADTDEDTTTSWPSYHIPIPLHIRPTYVNTHGPWIVVGLDDGLVALFRVHVISRVVSGPRVGIPSRLLHGHRSPIGASVLRGNHLWTASGKDVRQWVLE